MEISELKDLSTYSIEQLLSSLIIDEKIFLYKNYDACDKKKKIITFKSNISNCSDGGSNFG